MNVELSVVRDLASLRALEPEWRQLAQGGGSGALFRGPDWLVPWWLHYHQVLQAELHVIVGRVDGELVCLAPLYARAIDMPLITGRELRLLGDAGPRPPALDLLVRAGAEDRVGVALARQLIDLGDTWDLIDLQPLAEPSRVRAAMVSRLAAAGLAVESAAAGGGARRIALAAPGLELDEPSARAATHDGLIEAFTDEPGIRMLMSQLRRLSRLEWADREETSPFADAEAAALLEEVALCLAPSGRARMVRQLDSTGAPAAAALIVDDGDRAVVLALAVDPPWVAMGAPTRLLAHEAHAARMRGRVALDVVTGAAEYALPPLPASRQQALAVRVWGATRTASVGRTVKSVRRGVEAARDAPSAAAAQARAAWAKIRSAVGHAAQHHRLHLVRGQLWTRGIPHAPGLELAVFAEADYDKLDDPARADLGEQLGLDELTARRLWRRGDLAVLARLNGRPAGIAWSARGPVEAPELGRTLHLDRYEAYIHDVYVAPSARGRNVAPSMLELLALELRQRDVFRAWALIAHENVASVRAFEKASYTPVCDVIYTRIAGLDRLAARPPDPEARQLLGILQEPPRPRRPTEPGGAR
jgi:ribosomal protein S18 acetylase RimI-like enzyme